MGHKTLLPAKSLYPRSMMRPEEVSDVVTFSSEQKVTFTQILTNQWEELEHSLYGSETSNITIKKIEATSQGIRRAGNLPTPLTDAKSQPAQSTPMETFKPGSKNHKMSSQKRDRSSEPAPESVTSYLSTKRAKTDNAQVKEKTFARIENISYYYSHLLVIWSRPMTQQQKKFLDETIKGMLKLKSAVDLEKPPTTEQMSRWPKTIKKPMDLSTMIKLLENNQYRTVTDLCADFKTMITNAHLIHGENHDVSVAARRLFIVFKDRMRGCPTGVDGTKAGEYGKCTITLLESLIPDVTGEKAIQSSSDKSGGAINMDSDKDEVEAGNRPAAESKMRKTPEPDDLDDEATKIQKEIEERQQKLLSMAEKKGLLAEIKALDSKKIELESKKPGMAEQYELLDWDLQERGKEIETHRDQGAAILQKQAWYGKETERLDLESERLRQEIEKVRQSKEKIDLEAKKYFEKRQKLMSEKREVKTRREHVSEDWRKVTDRIVGLEDQRVIAKKKLDALDDAKI